MIGFEIVAKQREAQSPLPLKRPVASPAVAPQPPEQRNHMPLKGRRFRSLGDCKTLIGGKKGNFGGRGW